MRGAAINFAFFLDLIQWSFFWK